MMKFLLPFLTLLILASGCRQIDSLYEARVIMHTNYVSVAGTNATTGEVVWTPVEKVEPQTILVPKPQVITTIDTGKRFIPMPYGDILAAVLALAYGVYASWRNKANEKTRDKIVGTLTENFEAAKTVIEKVSPGAKEALMKEVVQVQENRGVRDEVKEHL